MPKSQGPGSHKSVKRGQRARYPATEAGGDNKQSAKAALRVAVQQQLQKPQTLHKNNSKQMWKRVVWIEPKKQRINYICFCIVKMPLITIPKHLWFFFIIVCIWAILWSGATSFPQKKKLWSPGKQIGEGKKSEDFLPSSSTISWSIIRPRSSFPRSSSTTTTCCSTSHFWR